MTMDRREFIELALSTIAVMAVSPEPILIGPDPPTIYLPLCRNSPLILDSFGIEDISWSWRPDGRVGTRRRT